MTLDEQLENLKKTIEKDPMEWLGREMTEEELKNEANRLVANDKAND